LMTGVAMVLKNREYFTRKIACRRRGVTRRTPRSARRTGIRGNGRHTRRVTLASKASFFEFGSTTRQEQADDGCERSERDSTKKHDVRYSAEEGSSSESKMNGLKMKKPCAGRTSAGFGVDVGTGITCRYPTLPCCAGSASWPRPRQLRQRRGGTGGIRSNRLP
jgi:hypothetical protein